MYKLTDLYKQLKEEEESNKSPYKIFCDMDGVLTDFDARFRYFGNMDPRAYESKYGKEKFWDLIDSIDDGDALIFESHTYYKE